MTTRPTTIDTAGEVHQLLEAIDNLIVFRGRTGTLDLAEDKTVPAYVTAYYGVGVPRLPRLGKVPRHLDWSCQLTCAGGTDEKALWAVDQVRAALTGVRVTVGARNGLLHELGDPGPLRPDKDFTPWRFFLPLDFGLYL